MDARPRWPDVPDRLSMPFYRRVWRRFIMTEQQRRLEAAIEAWQTESSYLGVASAGLHPEPLVAAKTNRVGNSDGQIDTPAPDAVWYRVADRLYERARKALYRNEPEEAWQCVLAADRVAIDGLGSPEARAIAAIGMVNEGQAKLDGWRRKVVVKLLTHDGHVLKDPSSARLRSAASHLAERHTNVYRRIDAVRRQLRTLTLLFIVVLPAWYLLIGTADIDDKSITLKNIWLMGACAIMGVLGAILSGMLSLSRASLDQSIPELVLTRNFTLTRPVIGAISATALYVFQLAGIPPIEMDVDRKGVLILVLSFVSGFSERLLVKAVQTISPGDDTSDRTERPANAGGGGGAPKPATAPDGPLASGQGSAGPVSVSADASPVGGEADARG